MNRKFRLISIAGIVLFCALTYFAFSSTSALAAGPAPRPGTSTTQRPPAQQKPPAKKLVCPPTIRSKDRGDAVRKLQTVLNKQGFRNSRGRPLAVNGVLDNDTIFALKNFEAKHHLKVDGVAGPNVWQQLNQCNLR